jgi:hypothetical protein
VGLVVLAFIVINIAFVFSLILQYRIMTDEFQKAVLLRHILFVSTSTSFFCMFPGLFLLYFVYIAGSMLGISEDFFAQFEFLFHGFLVPSTQQTAIVSASLSGFVLSMLRLAELSPKLNGSKLNRNIAEVHKDDNIYIRLTSCLMTDVSSTQCLLFTISAVSLMFKCKQHSNSKRWAFTPADINRISTCDSKMNQASQL